MGAPPLRFASTYHVRFDEAGADGALRSSGFLRYAQDLAWQHSEAAGFDREWYREQGVHWLVRSVVLEELARVPYGSVVHSTTEVTGWRRVWARRESRFSLTGGEAPVATMVIDWVLLDERGRPARVPDEIARFFAPGASFTPARVRLPETPSGTATWRARVRHQDVDPMGHVNNAAYVDYLEEALVGSGGAGVTAALPRTRVLEYLRPTLPGSQLVAACWPTAGGWVWRLTDGAADELCRALVRVPSPSW